MKMRLRLPLVLAAVLAPLAAQAADPWPSRPIRLVVPFSAGGATDTVARELGQRMSTVWKQPVIIDNKPGAGTVLGTDIVAKAHPDGYTFGMVVSAHTINPSLRSKLPYDTLKDFAAVTEVGVQHMIIAAMDRLIVLDQGRIVEQARTASCWRPTACMPGCGRTRAVASWAKRKTKQQRPDAVAG